MRKNKKLFEDERRTILALTSRGVKIWTVVILTIAGWMFGLGVLVGRGKAPVTFDIDIVQQEFAALRENMAARQRQKEEAPAAYKESDAAPAMEFHRTLRDSRSDGAFNHDLDRIEQPSAPPLASVSGPESGKPVSRGATSDKPAPSRPASEKTTPVAETALWTIQVAAVKDADDADRMVESLQEKGYDAYRVTVDVAPDNTWHRVRVGVFTDRDQAGEALARLVGDKIEGFVARR